MNTFVLAVVNAFTIFSMLLVAEICISSYVYISAFKDNTLLITQGVAAGDVTDTSAIVWSRANREAQMNVEYDTHHIFSQPQLVTAVADRFTDFAAKVKLEGLEPDSLYYYRVWFTIHNGSDNFASSNIENGSFRTAPENLTSRQVNFVIGGDLGGQGFCRRINIGYPIFSLMKESFPDFFIFNGDQIYADSDCPGSGPSVAIGWHNVEGNFPSVLDKSSNWTNLVQLHDIYLKHWEYNRNDTHLQNLLRHVSYYSQFDDHEVIDNYGGNWTHMPSEELKNKTGFGNLVKTGINLFSNFSPIYITEENNQKRYYRSFNWGKGLDLFILDTRSYRNNNTLLDNLENNKTLLGREQMEWLKQGLFNSTATWKIISTSNAITIPTCSKYGCDSWATNGTDDRTFISDRTNLLEFLDENNIRNVVSIVTDVHFPANIVVNEDFNGDNDTLIFHELASGPLSAAPLRASELDPSINATLLYSENEIFNFGHITIRNNHDDKKEHLLYRVIDSNGITRPGSVLELTPN